MKIFILHIFVFMSCLFGLFTPIYAQLDSVKFRLQYNPSSDEFDMFMHIMGGNATTIARRTQANCLISIVVPTGSEVEIVRRYMPLEQNHQFTGTTPNDWKIGPHLINPSAIGLDFYGITPALSPVSHYNQLNVGDTIKLFSLKINVLSGCIDDIKLFENIYPVDIIGPFDFSLGMTIGSIKQLYRGNLPPTYPDIAGANIQLEKDSSKILTTPHEGNGQWSIWSSRAGLVLHEPNPDEFIVEALNDADGAYTLQYKEDGITDFVCVQILNPAVQFSGDPIICNGLPTQIKAGYYQDATYLWNDGTVGKYLYTSQPGIYTVTVTTLSGDKTEASMEIFDSKIMVLPVDSFCIGQVFSLPDDFPGRWTTDKAEIISIDNNLKAGCLQQGVAQLTFLFDQFTCQVNSVITVNEIPVLQALSSTSICERETTILSSPSEGNWISLHPWIVTTSIIGVISGVSSGLGDILFIDKTTGCVSDTMKIHVLPKPLVANNDRDTICVEQIIRFQPGSGGIWSSLHPEIAEISSGGMARSISPGVVEFSYHSDTMTCPNYIKVVVDKPNPRLLSTFVKKTGDFVLLSSSSEGIWTSSNTNILQIINNERAKVLQHGHSILHFESYTGCAADLSFGFDVEKPFPGLYPNSQFSNNEQVFYKSAISDDYSYVNEYKLFPNPATDYISFTGIEGIKSLEVFDIRGNSILLSEDTVERLDVTSLVPGTYFVRLFSEVGKSILLPFVIAHK